MTRWSQDIVTVITVADLDLAVTTTGALLARADRQDRGMRRVDHGGEFA